MTEAITDNNYFILLFLFSDFLRPVFACILLLLLHADYSHATCPANLEPWFREGYCAFTRTIHQHRGSTDKAAIARAIRDALRTAAPARDWLSVVIDRVDNTAYIYGRNKGGWVVKEHSRKYIVNSKPATSPRSVQNAYALLGQTGSRCRSHSWNCQQAYNNIASSLKTGNDTCGCIDDDYNPFFADTNTTRFSKRDCRVNGHGGTIYWFG